MHHGVRQEHGFECAVVDFEREAFAAVASFACDGVVFCGECFVSFFVFYDVFFCGHVCCLEFE